ncbi:hypothetical protein ABEV04_05720 [Heyndrickxia faecalis]|uniref:hypothetical protein n=1 Tax=Heyndrickxia TaxID=2837504 RepID=UPI002E22D7FC|nr:hypothetical protein [Weizmannia sp. CD-2023]
MSFLTDMLSKLPDMFKKTTDSNIGKIFSIVGAQMDDLQSTLDKMELWRDIDEAEGVVLDRIGLEILQEPRGGVSDDEYRLKLKTRIIISYLSDGDIESIIKLLEVYMGDHLVSVQTGVDVDDGPFAGQPATLVITIKGQDDPISIPYDEISKVLVGGVGTQWEYINDRLFSFLSKHECIMYPFEYFAGWITPDGEKQTNENVDIVTNLTFRQHQENVLQDEYPISGDYVQNNDISDHDESYVFTGNVESVVQDEYMICGDNNINTDVKTNLELTMNHDAALQETYPICGTFVAGEVV